VWRGLLWHGEVWRGFLLIHPFTNIIVLCHNRLDITKKFVDKLFSNTDNFGLIFIDNGSTDDTNKFLLAGEKEKKWRTITSVENLGVIGGRNLGLKYIESQFFVNLDNDQYPQSGWLEKLHALMGDEYSMTGCEAWRLLPPNTPGVVSLGSSQINDRGYFPHHKCTRPSDKFSYLGGGGTLIKRQVIDKIGVFDDRFSPAYFEDSDFSFRAIQAGFKLGWCHNCPIVHLGHQTFNNQTLFQKNTQFVRSWLEFRKKWGSYYPEPMSMTS